MSNVIVTTGDLKQEYEILGPVYFQVSNKRLIGRTMKTLMKKYEAEIQQKEKAEIMTENRSD